MARLLNTTLLSEGLLGVRDAPRDEVNTWEVSRYTVSIDIVYEHYIHVLKPYAMLCALQNPV